MLVLWEDKQNWQSFVKIDKIDESLATHQEKKKEESNQQN